MDVLRSASITSALNLYVLPTTVATVAPAALCATAVKIFNVPDSTERTLSTAGAQPVVVESNDPFATNSAPSTRPREISSHRPTNCAVPFPGVPISVDPARVVYIVLRSCVSNSAATRPDICAMAWVCAVSDRGAPPTPGASGLRSAGCSGDSTTPRIAVSAIAVFGYAGVPSARTVTPGAAANSHTWPATALLTSNAVSGSMTPAMACGAPDAPLRNSVAGPPLLTTEKSPTTGVNGTPVALARIAIFESPMSCKNCLFSGCRAHQPHTSAPACGSHRLHRWAAPRWRMPRRATPRAWRR